MSRQRYEKEIEEILKKAGEDSQQEQPQGSSGPPRRRRSTSSRRRISVRRIGFNYKIMLLGGLVLLVVSYFADSAFVFLAALALFVVGYVFYYRAPRGSGPGVGSSGAAGPRMWRGRPIDPEDPEDPPTRGRRR